MEIQLNCHTCWPLRFTDCPDELVFPLGLSATTEYDWKIQDSKGNIYEGTDTTNGSGTLTIDTTQSPFDSYPGLFNQYNGSFRLTVLDGSGNPLEFTVLGTDYTCVSFSFKDTVEIDQCEDSTECICWLAGSAVPSDLIGDNGDYYFKFSGSVYRKLYNTWSVVWTDGGGGGSSAWGSITGTLSNQTDLQTALNAKVPATRAINTTAPLAGGGDLSADRTLTLTLGNLLQVVSNALTIGGTATGAATINMANFKFLLQTQIDAFKTSAFEKFVTGNEHYTGLYGENTGSNQVSLVRAIVNAVSGEIFAEIAAKCMVTNTQTGFQFKEPGIVGVMRGDLALTVNTVVGTFTISEGVTANNGATGTFLNRTGTKIRVLPLTGNWTAVTSITGNTSAATANVSAILGQQQLWGDHNGYIYLYYDEHSGIFKLGHSSTDRPASGVALDGNIGFVDYPESRDDSGVTPPVNFLYTDVDGAVLSAPLSEIGGGNTIYTADDLLTGDRVVDGDGNDLAFENVGEFRVEATHNHATDAAAVIRGSNNAGGPDIELQAFGGGGIKVGTIFGDPDYDSRLGIKNNLLTPYKADKQFIGTLAAGANALNLVDSFTNFNHFKADTSGGAVTATIDSTGLPTLEFTIKDISGNASVNNITIESLNGTDTFDGDLNIVLTDDYACITIVYNGDGTYSIKSYFP